MDVHRDSATRDKLIFPSAITKLLRHFSIPFLASDHFTYMCAIDAATVKWSEMQFRSRQSGSAASSTRSAPSTSAPFSSTSGMTFRDIMTQLQRMDAYLDTLPTKLYQVNTCVDRVAR